MDWATLTRDQVENDKLPRVCMVCGEPATEQVNRTFTQTPEWVEFLYLAGIFPGMIAQHFFGKEMRVSCPVCPKHRTHWSNLIWVAGIGWLLAVPCSLFGLALGAALFPVKDPRTAGFVVAGGVIGIVIWLAVVIRLTVTRVKVTKISLAGDEITFERVSDVFAKAAANTKFPPPTS